MLFDIRHGFVDRLTDVAAFREREQMLEPRSGSEIDDSFGVICRGLVDPRSATPRGRAGFVQFTTSLGKPRLREPQEDQPENRT